MGLCDTQMTDPVPYLCAVRLWSSLMPTRMSHGGVSQAGLHMSCQGRPSSVPPWRPCWRSWRSCYAQSMTVSHERVPPHYLWSGWTEDGAPGMKQRREKMKKKAIILGLVLSVGVFVSTIPADAGFSHNG